MSIDMARKYCVYFGLVCLLGSYAQAEDAGPRVLATWEGVQVTDEDVKRYLRFKLPDRDPAELIARPGALENYIQTLLMLRTLAAKAEEENLLPEDQIEWQLRNQRNEWLVSAYQRKRVNEAMADVDWDSLALETYKAEPEQYLKSAEVDAAHILIRTDKRSEDEALALAREVYEKAINGADFNELAKEYSEDESVQSNGGELGAFTSERMVPAFSKAAFALKKPGDISEPVKTRFGYHVIKLNRHIDAERHPFAAVKSVIIEKLQKKMRGDIVGDLLARTRTDSLEAELDEVAMDSFKARLLNKHAK